MTSWAAMGPSKSIDDRQLGFETLAVDDVYGGTHRYLEQVHRASGAGHTQFTDLSSDPDQVWEHLTANTRIVWFESPSNPNLKVTDIAAAARGIRDHAAQSGGERP